MKNTSKAFIKLLINLIKLMLIYNFNNSLLKSKVVSVNII